MTNAQFVGAQVKETCQSRRTAVHETGYFCSGCGVFLFGFKFICKDHDDTEASGAFIH